MSIGNYITSARWWPFGRTVQTADTVPAPAPPAGESRTGGQAPSMTGGAGSVWAPDLLAGMPPAPVGDYPVWRAMDADPALTLSRAVITAPIREASPSFEAREGTKEEWVKLVQASIEPLWPEFLREALDALSMGWKPFEVPYRRENGRTLIADLKPLAQELTSVLARDGQFAGLRNDAKRGGNGFIDLAPANGLIVTVDGKNRDPYGRTWHENARDAWWRKVNCYAALHKLNRKASGTQAQVAYPPAGDAATNGGVDSNEGRARALLQEWMLGNGVIVPNASGILNPDTAADFRNIKGFAATTLWGVITEQFKDTGPQSLAILQQIQACNVDLSRAWHVPERASMEGEHGTKAEASVHTDIATAMSQLVYGDVCQALSRGPIDAVLAENFGEQARGAVWVAAGKLRDVFADADWRLIDAVLKNADLFMAVAEQTDLDAVFVRRGIPLNVDTLSLDKAFAEARQRREDARKQIEAATEKPVNGNGLALARGTEWLGRMLEGD